MDGFHWQNQKAFLRRNATKHCSEQFVFFQVWQPLEVHIYIYAYCRLYVVSNVHVNTDRGRDIPTLEHIIFKCIYAYYMLYSNVNTDRGRDKEGAYLPWSILYSYATLNMDKSVFRVRHLGETSLVYLFLLDKNQSFPRVSHNKFSNFVTMYFKYRSSWRFNHQWESLWNQNHVREQKWRADLDNPARNDNEEICCSLFLLECLFLTCAFLCVFALPYRYLTYSINIIREGNGHSWKMVIYEYIRMGVDFEVNTRMKMRYLKTLCFGGREGVKGRKHDWYNTMLDDVK